MSSSYCRICGAEFPSRTNAVYCSSICRLEAKRLQYKRRIYRKKCLYCGVEFNGVKQKKLCSSCEGTKRNTYDEIDREVICRRCGQSMGFVTRKATRPVSGAHESTCDDCKTEIRENSSADMHHDNPMKYAAVRAKCVATKEGLELTDELIEEYSAIRRPDRRLSSDEVRQLHSERMRKKNPMKDPRVRRKVSKTLRRRYANGEIAKKMSTDHWLWKGTRDRCRTIRSRLKTTWVKPILERDNYTCASCGQRGGRLEVHHVSPTFRSVVEEALGGRLMTDLSQDEFDILSDEVVKQHERVIGVTYCRKCHRSLDSGIGRKRIYDDES